MTKDQAPMTSEKRIPLTSLYEELCRAQQAGASEIDLKRRIGQFAQEHGQDQAREYLSYVPRESGSRKAESGGRQRGMEF